MALENCNPPQNIHELRSFLGMLNFSCRFISDFSNKTYLLRNLTKKNSRFVWSKAHNDAFNSLKKELSNIASLNYFNPKLESNVYVDASPYGVAAILYQENGPVAFKSRSLSEVEKRYSQTERESLSIGFGINEFHHFLYGSRFTIYTDHKSLVDIFNNHDIIAPPRIERVRIKTMGYNFNVKYCNGKYNPADYCSRHISDYLPCRSLQKEFRDSEQYIYSISYGTRLSSESFDL